MPDTLEILRLKVLLCFLNEDTSLCTVTGLSGLLNEGKQKISRLMMSMEKDGLLNRDDPRKPRLTEIGKQQAVYYEERTSMVLNHLLYEGVDIDSAEQDAYAWALFSSDNAMKVLRSSEQRYRAKYELRNKRNFDGTILCNHLQDGEYGFPFLIYRENVQKGSNISMANEGFEHPCLVVVKNGVGTIYLRPINITAKSQHNGKEMNGKVRNLCYLDNGEFKPVHEAFEQVSFPASSLSFLNIGTGMGQLLHGSVCLKMQCSVGTNHMPESVAIFTILI